MFRYCSKADGNVIQNYRAIKCKLVRMLIFVDVIYWFCGITLFGKEVNI